jgi:hypothetical protein
MNQFVTNTYFSGCNLGRIGKVLAAAADNRIRDQQGTFVHVWISRIRAVF